MSEKCPNCNAVWLSMEDEWVKHSKERRPQRAAYLSLVASCLVAFDAGLTVDNLITIAREVGKQVEARWE